MHKQFAVLVYDHATATFQVRIRLHTCEYVLAHTSVCVLIFVYRLSSCGRHIRDPHTSAHVRMLPHTGVVLAHTSVCVLIVFIVMADATFVAL